MNPRAIPPQSFQQKVLRTNISQHKNRIYDKDILAKTRPISTQNTQKLSDTYNDESIVEIKVPESSPIIEVKTNQQINSEITKLKNLKRIQQ